MGPVTYLWQPAPVKTTGIPWGYTVIHIDPLTGLVTSEKNDQFSDELSSSITSMLDKYSRYIPAYQVTRVIPAWMEGLCWWLNITTRP